MPASDDLRDQLLAHHVGLRRTSNSFLREQLKILGRNDREVVAILRRRLPEIAALMQKGFDPRTGEMILQIDQFTKRRLAIMYDEIRVARARVARALHAQLKGDLSGLAAYEQEYIRKAVSAAIPKPVLPMLGDFALASQPLLNKIVTSKPFQGKILRDHFRDLLTRNGPAAKRLKHAVEDGLVQGKSITQIVKGVKHAALGLTRANVAAVTHTAVSHVTSATRLQFGQDNADVVAGYYWVGTLDSKICSVCIIRDGHEYDMNYEPVSEGAPPWGAGPGGMHYNDRCDASYVLHSLKDMGIDPRKMDGATRASMDGGAPRSMTAEQWVDKQGYDRLEGMFGAKRAQLLTDGNLDIRDLVRKDGTLYTLKQLQGIEGAAFEAAGL